MVRVAGAMMTTGMVTMNCDEVQVQAMRAQLHDHIAMIAMNMTMIRQSRR